MPQGDVDEYNKAKERIDELENIIGWVQCEKECYLNRIFYFFGGRVKYCLWHWKQHNKTLFLSDELRNILLKSLSDKREELEILLETL